MRQSHLWHKAHAQAAHGRGFSLGRQCGIVHAACNPAEPVNANACRAVGAHTIVAIHNIRALLVALFGHTGARKGFVNGKQHRFGGPNENPAACRTVCCAKSPARRKGNGIAQPTATQYMGRPVSAAAVGVMPRGACPPAPVVQRVREVNASVAGSIPRPSGDGRGQAPWCVEAIE